MMKNDIDRIDDEWHNQIIEGLEADFNRGMKRLVQLVRPSALQLWKENQVRDSVSDLREAIGSWKEAQQKAHGDPAGT